MKWLPTGNCPWRWRPQLGYGWYWGWPGGGFNLFLNSLITAKTHLGEDLFDSMKNQLSKTN
jgi:hypothetical protein